MRPWLLLVSLLVSDRSPPGNGDWVMDYYTRSLCRKRFQMTPLGLEILQTEHRSMLRNCLCVAVQHKRTSPFYWAHTDHHEHGCSLFQQEFTGIIHRNHIPALVVSLLHGKGKRAPVFLLRSDSLPALHVIRETSHIAMDIIKDHPDSWTLHHHTAASGRSFQAFLLEKCKSWAPDTIFQLQKMLTKRYCAAATVIIPCCFKEGEITPAMNIKKISKEQIAQMEKRRRRAMDIKVPMKYDGQAAVRQHDVVKAATLHSGSSSMKTSDRSQLEIQRNPLIRVIKKNEHLNLQNSAQKQHPLKAASSVYNDDGVEKQLLLVSRENTGSINSPQYKIKATQGDDKEDFNGKRITKQAEFRLPERSHTNTTANRNQKRLAYILQAPHKTDNNDVDTKQVLTEAGEEVLIMLLLPGTERDTQTESSSERKLILNSDTGWKTVNIPIKELDDTPPMTKVIKESFIIEPGSLKGCLFSLEMYALDRTERIDIKPAESTAEVTTVSVYTEEQVKETKEEIEHTETDNSTCENMGINHTKQEGNVPSEEPVVPSPPSLKTTERETAKTERIVETTPVNMEIKETTPSMEVFNRGSTQKADSPPPTETPRTTMSPESETDAQPRFITGNIQATTEKSFSGLRIIEDITADTIKLHDGRARAVTNRSGTDRKEVQKNPKVDAFTFAKPLLKIHKTTERIAETTPVNMEIKETTSSMEVFNRGSTQKTDNPPPTETPRTTMSPESETDAEPRYIKYITGNIQATTEKSSSTKLHEGPARAVTNRPGTDRKEVQKDPKVDAFTFAKPLSRKHKKTTEKSFSGLRIIEDIPADTIKLHDGRARAVTIRPGTDRKEVQKNPKVDSFTFAKPLLKIHKTTERIAETTPVNMEIKETTSSMGVSNRGSTQKADSPPRTETPRTTMSPKSETDAEPRYIKCVTGNIRATTEKSFSTKLHEGTARAVTNRSGTDRKEVQKDPKVDSFTFAKPLSKIHKTTERIAETTPVNMEIKETTSSMGVSNRGSTQKADSPPRTETPRTTMSPESETDAEPRFITGNIQATTEKSFSGLRMRQDIPADTTKLHEVTAKAVTTRPGTDRKEDPKVDSFTFAKPLSKIHKNTEHIAETTPVNMEIKETTSSTEVFNRGSTQKTDSPPPRTETPRATMSPESETDAEPRYIKYITGNIHATTEKSSSTKLHEGTARAVTNRPGTDRKEVQKDPKVDAFTFAKPLSRKHKKTTEKSFSGLRMIEDIPADTIKLHDGRARAVTNRPGTDRKEVQKNPKVDSFTFAKPLLKIHKTTERIAETTPVNMEIKDTTSSMGVSNRGSTQKADSPPRTETPRTTMSPKSETDAEPRYIKCVTGNIRATTEKSFSTKLHEGTARAVTNRSGTDRKEVQKDPKVDAFTFAKPLSKIHKTTERIVETTPVNMEIKETTSSMGVSNRGSTQKADSPPPTETPRTTMSPKSETDAEPRLITGNIQTTTEKSFSGLRMRQDIPADTTKLHEGTARAVTTRPGTDRKEDPRVDSFTFTKPSPTIYKPATDTLRKTADDNVPLCRGLIHRTEAGWKHCTERSAGMGTKRFSSDAFKDTREPWERERMFIRDQKDNAISDDEYDHFYYFDGVLKRVRNNFYPRQRRRKRSPDNSKNSVFTVRNKQDTRENLLSYIQRLTLRNKSPQMIRYRR